MNCDGLYGWVQDHETELSVLQPGLGTGTLKDSLLKQLDQSCGSGTTTSFVGNAIDASALVNVTGSAKVEPGQITAASFAPNSIVRSEWDGTAMTGTTTYATSVSPAPPTLHSKFVEHEGPIVLVVAILIALAVLGAFDIWRRR